MYITYTIHLTYHTYHISHIQCTHTPYTMLLFAPLLTQPYVYIPIAVT